MDEILVTLNNWLDILNMPAYIRYSYRTNGFDEQITLLGVVVWDNLDMDVYDEDDNELSITEVVKRETKNLIDNMKHISFKGFPV